MLKTPYRLYCNTDKKMVSLLSQGIPTGCPFSFSHNINPSSVTVDLSAIYNSDIIVNPIGSTGPTGASIPSLPVPTIAIGNTGASINITNNCNANYNINMPTVAPTGITYLSNDGNGNLLWTPTCYAIIRDEKISGSNGGTMSINTTGIWNTRALNVIETNIPNLVSISSNRITIQPGAYYFCASSPASQVDYHQIRLQCITGPAEVLGTITYGTSAFSPQTYNYTVSSIVTQSESKFETLVTASDVTVLEIQHRGRLMSGNPNPGTIGMGVACGLGTKEVYTVVRLQKL